MRIAVMGAGAVGGFFGAKLAMASHDVIFIARGKHLEAMRRRGLIINSPQGDLHVRTPSFVGAPAEAGAVDLVLFCVKSYDTEGAAEQIGPLIRAHTTILSLQNGVDNVDKIAFARGKEKILAGVVNLGARVSQPGVVEHEAAGEVVVGALDESVHESTGVLQRAFLAARIPCTTSTEIRRLLWEKLLWNAAFCAIASLTRSTVRQIVESESLQKLALDCMEEAHAAARLQGVGLTPATVEETFNLSRSLGDLKPSMLRDLESLKPLEYEAFNGIVVKSLRAAGMAAPVNQVFYGALKYLDKTICGTA